MTQANAASTPADTDDKGTLAGLRDRASHAAEVTGDTARDTVRRAADGIEANPIAVLAGGIALGAIAGALIPRSEGEQKVLGPLGKRLSETAVAAAAAAREAGREQLSAALPDRDAAKESLRTAVGNVVQAATQSGRAAAKGETA